MEFSAEIIKLLEWIASKFGIIIDWAATDIIPKITEILYRFVNYKIVLNLIFMGIFLAIFIVSLIVSIRLFKKDAGMLEDDAIGGVVFGALAALSLVFVFILGHAALAWYMIPEIKLFEYLKTMMAS